jgi:hypothetical protein
MMSLPWKQQQSTVACGWTVGEVLEEGLAKYIDKPVILNPQTLEPTVSFFHPPSPQHIPMQMHSL